MEPSEHSSAYREELLGGNTCRRRDIDFNGVCVHIDATPPAKQSDPQYDRPEPMEVSSLRGMLLRVLGCARARGCSRASFKRPAGTSA